MSDMNNGEEDNFAGVSKDKNKNETHEHSIENKDYNKEETQTSEDKIEKLIFDSDKSKILLFKSKLVRKTHSHIRVIVQTLHNVSKRKETLILPEVQSENIMSSSQSNSKVDGNRFQRSRYPEINNTDNFLFVVNSDGTIKAKPDQRQSVHNIDDTDDSMSQVSSFHRKDYQVMMYFGGGIRPSCMFGCLNFLFPHGGYRPECYNVYVTHVTFTLLIMLMVTAYCMYYNLNNPRVRYWHYRNWWQIILGALTAILFLNYLMFSYIMEKYLALNYICLILAVIACTMFLTALSARTDSDALWMANTMTIATVLSLFLLSFTNVNLTQRALCLIAVLFSLLVLIGIVYSNKVYSYFGTQYPNKVIYVVGFLGALRIFLLVLELQRLLRNCVDHGCCDHAFGAYILYTLYLQFIFFLFQWVPFRRNFA